MPRIRIHPSDPERVWCTPRWATCSGRTSSGVFFAATTAAQNWERVLHVSDEIGAVDLAMDPTNPRILYASFWRVLRTPWSLESWWRRLGPVEKSTDGGDSWQRAVREQAGLAEAAPGDHRRQRFPTANPENLYAIVEAAEGGVFRSRDGGETWKRTNKERKAAPARLVLHVGSTPTRRTKSRVYVPNVRFHLSKDGGKTFSARIGTPHGDNHDLWIAPDDPLRMIEANDGGANVSYDGGETWSTQSNQPTAQMYRLSTDNAVSLSAARRPAGQHGAAHPIALGPR